MDHQSCVSLRKHLTAIREADRRFSGERDRRYAEVNIEREKALKIKETADLAALQLAREIQEYKDAKANELREQISSERGLYSTKEELAALAEKFELAFKPVIEFMASYRGGTDVKTERRLDVSQVIAVIAVLALIISVLLPHLK